MRRDKYRFVSPPGALQITGERVKITSEDQELVKIMRNDLLYKYGHILSPDDVQKFRKKHRLTQ